MHFKVYSRYFYSKLDEKSKSAYQKILQGWLELKTSINLFGSYRDTDFNKVFLSLSNDNPELFYINFNSISVVSTPLQSTVKVKFHYSKDEIELLKNKIYKVVSDFKLKNKHISDKEKAIHDFLAQKVSYSTNLYSVNSHNICGPLIENSAVCEGYALAFKLLCDEMQIPCMIVNGTAQDENGISENHSWNIVRVNNTNFHVDVTWNSDLMRNNAPSVYYNVSESFIRKNHLWDIRVWPRCQTIGEFEKKIITVDSFDALCQNLTKLLKVREKHIIFSSFSGINSTETASQTIGKAFCKIKSKIYAYSVIYIKKVDCIVVMVEY